MDGLPKLSRAQYIESMRGPFEEVLGGVADAVNAAPDGQILNASEEKGRDLFARFRQAALQARIPVQAVQVLGLGEVGVAAERDLPERRPAHRAAALSR